MSTIRKDVAETPETTGDDFDATSAFLSQLEGTKDEDDANEGDPSDQEDDQDPKDTPAGDDDEDNGSDASPDADGDEDEGSEDDDEGGKGSEKKYADDDGVYVKITEGDKEHEVPLKDLKRLYGQEASLTRKSQEVAEVRKTAEATTQKHVSALQVLVERAKEKANPFRQIDWMAVSKDPNISAEEATALRSAAQHALEEEQFLTSNLDSFMEEVGKQNHAKKIEEAKSCVKALITPGTEDKPNPLHIEGWNDKVYTDVRSFGVKMGAPEEYMNSLTDPVSMKALHMAMQFAKGTKGVVTTKKVNKTPKKIVKTSNSPVTSRDSSPKAARKDAINNLRKNPNKTGAAADAFYASFGIEDSD